MLWDGCVSGVEWSTYWYKGCGFNPWPLQSSWSVLEDNSEPKMNWTAATIVHDWLMSRCSLLPVNYLMKEQMNETKWEVKYFALGETLMPNGIFKNSQMRFMSLQTHVHSSRWHSYLHQFVCLCANVCMYECLWHHLFLGANRHHFMLLLLRLCARDQAIVPLCGFHGGELGYCHCCFQWVSSDDTLVAVLQGPHLLPSQWWMMWRLTAKQGPLLPVISPNLQNSFFERPCC